MAWNFKLGSLEFNWNRKVATTEHPTQSVQEHAPTKKIPDNETDVELPVSGARSSIPENVSQFSILDGMAQVDPLFNIEYIKTLEHLSMMNADVSLAVANIVELASTPHTIEFDSTVPDEQAQAMRQHIEEKSRAWYNHAEGMNSLISDLMGQIVVSGALSAEILPKNDLSGVRRIVMVSPVNIRFTYDKAKDVWKPFQKINGTLGLQMINGLHPLNEVTYKYFALRRLNENPYAVPPLLSALENVAIEMDMQCNVKNIVKKLGILGFLNVLLTRPVKNVGESDVAYTTRLKAYLNTQAPEVEKSLGKGYVMGFKDFHEFKLDAPPAGNAQGAKELMEMNDTKKMAGLKQDPMLMGRNFSTAETLGRVIIAKFGKQIDSYQKIVAAFLREAYLIDLNLAGFPVSSLFVRFERPMIYDEQKEETTYKTKIENAGALYQAGIVSQLERAQMLGFDAPDQEEPRPQMGIVDPNVDPEDDGEESDKGTAPDKAGKTSNTIEDGELGFIELGGLLPEFPYELCNCGTSSIPMSFKTESERRLNEYMAAYEKAMGAEYKKAIKKVTAKIGAQLAQMGQGATEQQVTDRIIATLYKEWGAAFKGKEKVVSKYVKLVYSYFRKDQSIFNADPKKAVEAVFGMTDFRALTYFKASDELYLGKFITDKDVRKRMTQWIKDEYLEGNMPIGKNAAMQTKFRSAFGELMDTLGAMRIQRIIDTTVNKMRNYGAIGMMNQAEVEEFEIVGVNDSLQCAYCATMQGKRFSVATAFDKIDQIVKSEPNYVREAAPFINSVFKKPADMAGLSASQLQGMGIDVPAYHPGCRDQVIAVL